jgi:hypothetical protein
MPKGTELDPEKVRKQLTLITDFLGLLSTGEPTMIKNMWVNENKVHDKMKKIVGDLRDLETKE